MVDQRESGSTACIVLRHPLCLVVVSAAMVTLFCITIARPFFFYSGEKQSKETKDECFHSIDVTMHSQDYIWQCHKCRAGGQGIVQSIRQLHKDQLLNFLLEACSKSSWNRCPEVMRTYIDQIYQPLISEVSAFKLCHWASVCSMKYHQHNSTDSDFPVDQSILKNCDSCTWCKNWALKVRDVIQAGMTENDFLHVFNGFCGQLGSFDAECKLEAEKNYKRIFAYLTEEYNPKDVCTWLGACSPPSNNTLLGSSNKMFL